MELKFLLLALSVGILFAPFYVNDVFGHGLGGDVAPPIDFGGMSVTVSTNLTPYDLTAGEIDSANMGVRFFDTETDTTLEKVTYRVEIWKSDKLIARHNFYDADGNLDVEIRPVLDCTELQLWKCTEYYGTEHPEAPGALYVQGTQRPVIKGPIFDEGGLYNIKVHIEAATGARTLVTSALSYDTFISVAQEQPFTIPTASAETPITLKTYYDKITNFEFSQSDNSITFDMPFDWDPEYVEYVPVIHEELHFPKSLGIYNEKTQFKGYVDGVELNHRSLVLDPFTYKDKNIVHFLVLGDELKRINDVLGESHQSSEMMTFKLVPQSEIEKNSFDFPLIDSNGEPVGTTVQVSWDSSYGANDEIPFEITFFDENKNLLKDVRYGYNLIEQSTGTILEQDIGSDETSPGILAMEGITSQSITIPSRDLYRLDLVVFGQGDVGLDFDDTYSGVGSAFIEVGPQQKSEPTSGDTPPDMTKPEAIEIPSWIKTNAGWWAEDQITDDDFIQAIQYLIKEGIITIPVTEGEGSSDSSAGSSEIPSWIKTNAGWWAEDQITDDDFIQAIQYLIKEGILSI